MPSAITLDRSYVAFYGYMGDENDVESSFLFGMST